jgi:tetratricopeptide (TPR) repeat protein
MRHVVCILWVLLFVGVAGLSAQDAAKAPEVSEQYRKLYEQAVQQFQRNDMKGALATLDKAEKAQADIPQGYNLRGAIQVKLKNFDEARKAFEKSIAINPKMTMSLFNLGETEFLAKNYTQAKARFKTFLDQAGPNDLADYKVFLCNLLSGNDAEAKKMMDSFAPSPNTPVSYFCKAAWDFKKGDKEGAVQYLQSAFSIYPSGQNMLFADSMIELGWISSGDVPQPDTPSNTDATAAEAAASKPAAVDGLLPSLDKSKDKKKPATP